MLGTTSAIAVAASPREATGVKAAQAEYELPTDRDEDGVIDRADNCPFDAGDLRNGCPSELNAEVRAHWQVNRLLTKLVRLTVAAPLGSRIQLSCTGRYKICGKNKRVIARTTHRLTSLTKYFKAPRIYRARLNILVKVTKPQPDRPLQALPDAHGPAGSRDHRALPEHGRPRAALRKLTAVTPAVIALRRDDGRTAAISRGRRP